MVGTLLASSAASVPSGKSRGMEFAGGIDFARGGRMFYVVMDIDSDTHNISLPNLITSPSVCA